MKKLLLTGLISTILLGVMFSVVSADTAALDIQQSVSYVFGEELVFSLDVAGDQLPQDAWLFIQPAGMGIANFKVLVEEGGTSFVVTPSQLLLKPFSSVSYWFQLVYADGTEIVTDEEQFHYVDNSVEWQHTGNDRFNVYWQEGSLDFGAGALAVAQQAWDTASIESTQSPRTPLRIYIYSTSTGLQEALLLGNMPWVAGHADPQVNAILISISPGPEQRLEMQRQIPHELSHLFLYAVLQDGYADQPAWLLEGVASMAEISGNEEYSQALTKAAASNSLLSIDSLCTAFPAEEPDIYLAYAQSMAFTEYLRAEYGHSKLQDLMAAYSEGYSCTAGFSHVYSISLAQAQAEWQREEFGTQASVLIWQAIAPYLLLLLVLGVLPLAVTMLRRYRAERADSE